MTNEAASRRERPEVWLRGLLCALVLVAPSACSSSGDTTGPPDGGSTRPFFMGFTDFPHVLSVQGLMDAYDVIETRGDLVALHFDDGVPWQEALDGAPYPAGWVDELDGKASLVPAGHARYLAVTPLSSDRSGLAANRGANGSEPLSPPWSQRTFDDADVITAFGNHVLRMIDRFDPDYLAIAIEANMLFAAAPEKWDAFVDLIAAVRTRVRQAHPSLPTFVTLQAEYFHRDESAQTAALQSLLPQSDFVAVSTYPYFDRAPVSTVPENYLDAVAALAPQKPFAISESGWPAETVGDPWPETIVSSEAEQRAWVVRLLADSDRLNATFVVWFFTQDLDDAWDQGLKDSPSAAEVRLFRDTGLLDGAGASRSGMTAWRDVLARTREP